MFNFFIMIKIKPTAALARLAQRYVWWQSVAWSYAHPNVFLSNVMNLGCWDDIQALRKLVGDEVLKETLRHAQAGVFSYRSWDYWHVKFDMLPIPPLPTRSFK